MENYSYRTPLAGPLSFSTKNGCMCEFISFLSSCRGFGFVTYADQAGVEKVLAQNRHELDSKTVSFLFRSALWLANFFYQHVLCFFKKKHFLFIILLASLCILPPTVWLVKLRSAFWSSHPSLLLLLLLSAHFPPPNPGSGRQHESVLSWSSLPWLPGGPEWGSGSPC